MQAMTLLSSAILVIAVDQLAKALVIGFCPERQVVHFGAVRIRHILNRRAFSGRLCNRAILLLLIGETLFFVSIVQFTPIFDEVLGPVALGLAIGGAASNALDWALRCGVVDFIDLRIWPVFNVADVAIVVGTVTGVACI